MSKKNEYPVILLCFLIFITLISCVQEKAVNLTDLKGAYFGQEPPGENPELFMFGQISTLDVEYCITFLDKGRVCVFGRDDIGVNYTYLKDGRWTKPQKMTLDSENWEWKYNAGPDDKTLYFMSRRLTGSNDSKNEANIYKMKWMGSGWSKQEILPFPPNSDEFQEIYPSVSSDGSVYFHSGEFRNVPDMNDDIYRSRCVNGIYQEQERLNEPISTCYGEYDAFVAPDEEYLMFGSNRPGGYGQYDTYICFKKDDGSWTHPINAGNKLNSMSWENRVLVTPDRKFMFFVSGRGHELLNDELENGRYTSVTGFYWVDAAFIQVLKKFMLNSECAAEIISQEYYERGIQAAIRKLSELKTEANSSYHFSYSELLILCREMIEANKISDSDIFYHALLDTLDEDYRTKRGYGMICVMHGQTDKGLDLLRDAMSDYPRELMVTVYTWGIELLRISKGEDALEIMQFNGREYPDHPLSNFGLARAYEQLGNIEQAIKSCERALESSPDYSPAADLLKRLREKT